MNISKSGLTEQEDFGFQGNHTSPPKDKLMINSECRICLEQQNRSTNNPLIAPCYCSGSVRFVHFRCMSMWIQKNNRTPLCEITNNSQFVCEMCKTKIQFQCQHELSCHKWSEFVSSVKQQTCFFVFLTFLTLSGFILGCVGIVFLIIWSLNINFIDSPSLIITFCVILAFIFSGISLFLWLKLFAISIDTKIIRIGAITQNNFPVSQQLTTEYLNTEGNPNKSIFTSKKIHPFQIPELNSTLN